MPRTLNGLSSTILRQNFWGSSSPYLRFPQKKEKLKEHLTGSSRGTTSAHQAIKKLKPVNSSKPTQATAAYI